MFWWLPGPRHPGKVRLTTTWWLRGHCLPAGDFENLTILVSSPSDDVVDITIWWFQGLLLPFCLVPLRTLHPGKNVEVISAPSATSLRVHPPATCEPFTYSPSYLYINELTNHATKLQTKPLNPYQGATLIQYMFRYQTPLNSLSGRPAGKITLNEASRKGAELSSIL